MLREKDSIENDIIFKKKVVENPKIEIEKLLHYNRTGYGDSYKFFDSTQEIKSKFSRISQNKNTIDTVSQGIQKYQQALNLLNELKSITFHGIEFKIIDPKKNRQYIIDNRKRFSIAYSSTINTEGIKIIREDKNNTFEKFLSTPEKYSFLINLRQQIQDYEKNISERNKTIEELELANESIFNELIIEFNEWTAIEREHLENKIQILENEIKELGEKLFRLNVQGLYLETKIKNIEEGDIDFNESY